MLVAGPMMTGRYRGERLGACTDCRRFWARYRAGEVDDAEIAEVEGQLAVTAGTCAVMGTASTMACIAEALGMILPGHGRDPGRACRPAARRRGDRRGGGAADRLGAARPSGSSTRKSVENALRVLLALGGSTNAVIHLTAIAGRAGVKVTLDQLNELSDTTPVLVNLKPVGNGYMEDFAAAGGMGVLLRELAAAAPSRLHDGDRRDAGRAARGRTASRGSTARSSRRASSRSSRKAVWSRCSATSRRKGAILKRSAADAQLFEHEGRAVVFSSLADLAARIDDPALDVTPQDMLVLQNAGPHAPECMPEAGYLPIPKKLAPARRQGHDPHLRRAHERHRLRHHRAARHAGCGLRRPARPGAQRRPYPALGQGAAHRVSWSRTPS